MAELLGLFWVLCGIWCVSRAIDWFPIRLAQEEALFISEVLAQQTSNDNSADYAILQSSSLSFCWGTPNLSFKNLWYVTATVVVAVCTYTLYGIGLDFLLWTIWGWGLLVLAAVDYQTKLLPDALTLPLLWLGILIQLFPETRTVGLEMSVIGAVAGYLPLWLLAQAYRLIRGRDGLGMGDLKLLAAMGAWSGPFLLPQVLLLAALLAIAVFVIERVLRRSADGLHDERPFGPSIVAAYFIVLLFTHSLGTI